MGSTSINVAGHAEGSEPAAEGMPALARAPVAAPGAARVKDKAEEGAGVGVGVGTCGFNDFRSEPSTSTMHKLCTAPIEDMSTTTECAQAGPWELRSRQIAPASLRSTVPD